MGCQGARTRFRDDQMKLQGIRPQADPKPFRPFDYKDIVLPRLVERKFLQLSRVLDPVEVDMPERHAHIVIDLDDRKGRTCHLPLEAEAAQQATGEGRLAGAEIAEQSDDVAGAEAISQRAAERLRRLGRT